MTFEHEERTTTTASAAQVWALWSDFGTWSEWDPAVQAVVLDGPFRVGTTGTMTLTGGIQAPFVLEEVVPDAAYVDVLTLGELTIRIDHRVVDSVTGAEVSVRTTIDGPGADAIGPMVTGDAPKALRALVEIAERG